ncbi:hypothetical protein F4556_005926 [Kitasatospora gansuensis]|uniref:DUF4331 domain-containing protein n=1 Tax=Kitasatospora gansuensis TaxID=258050 RepID=A0A7W7SH54_9ACTN|nr:DUF4331 domain-containing protein [Kitasatospora gansuensis]MBB4950391.1 hypothetical protein [Kitasatospora gansuensis]
MSETAGTRRPSRRLFLGGAVATLAAASLGGPLLGRGQAGGHFDSPAVLADGQANITDVYAFTSPDDHDQVTIVVDVQPGQLPGAGPLNYPFATRARYEVHLDGRGTGQPDTTYRWTFRNEDKRLFGTGPIAVGPVRSLKDNSLLFKQRYTLERIRGGRTETLISDGTAAPTHTGLALMPDYGALRGEATRSLPGGGRTLAGQIAEPFVADTRVFGLFTVGTVGPVPGALPAAGPLSALNVGALVLQLPKRELALNGDPVRNPVVGIWATVSREGADLARDLRTQEATYRQIGRLGNPHIAFALWGTFAGLSRPGGPEDRFNARPAELDAQDQEFLAAALDPAPPRRIEAAQGFAAPAGPRTDIRALFLGGIGKDNGSRFGLDLNTQTMNADADPAAVRWADQLRLNLTTPVSADPHPYGVLDGDLQGYPNGRRLNDEIDVPLLRMLEGEPSDRSAAHLLPPSSFNWQPKPASNTFPYVNLPHAGP